MSNVQDHLLAVTSFALWRMFLQGEAEMGPASAQIFGAALQIIGAFVVLTVTALVVVVICVARDVKDKQGGKL